MKKFLVNNINTASYWDTHQTAMDFGLRQQKYAELTAGSKKVCELGCGLSPFLHGTYALEKWGVDFSPQTIRTCMDKYPDVRYLISDATHTPFQDKYFDAVVAGEIIEHLEDPESLIKEMKRLSKKLIVISTPILEFDDPEHLWEFDEEWFKERNFNTEVIESERFKGRKYIFAWLLL